MKLPGVRSVGLQAAGGSAGSLQTGAGLTSSLPNLRQPVAQDAVFLLLCGVVAFYDFHNTFSGIGFLLVGAVGLALGASCALLVDRTKVPLAALPLILFAAYFLLGGAVSLNNVGGSALLPVPGTLTDLLDASVQGWKNILTTLPPVNGGTVMAIPYLLGLVAGSAGMLASTRSRWAPAPLLVTGTLLGVVILLGTQSPSSVAVCGAIFAGLSIAWLVLRVDRGRPLYVTVGKARFSRSLTGGLLCAGVAALAAVTGGHLPGTRSDRSVLRSTVVPPFNVSQYPSPLVEFRRFTKGYLQVQPTSALYDTPLFKVTGLPRGTLIRIAALDTYDGNVWGAGNVAGSAPGLQDAGTSATDQDTFQKVGQSVASSRGGRAVRATVQILNGAFGPWVPLAGGLTGVTFTRPEQLRALNSFRYNLATQTAVMPQGLTPGDTYEFDANLEAAPLTPKTQLASGALPGVQDGSVFESDAQHWAGHGSANQQIATLAGYLLANGHYTDGGLGYQSFAAGHSLYRLNEFVSPSGQLAGDDEQFTALMALMANDLGVPARVVVGAQLPADGVVTGQDIHAWVELQTVSGSWVTLPETAYMGVSPPKKQSQQAKPSVPASVVPPPAPALPPANAGEPLAASVYHPIAGNSGKRRSAVVAAVVGAIAYVGPPVGGIILVCAAIVGLKLLRRNRRRRKGPPTRRLAFAWREVLDHARDFGIASPARATRREQAAVLGFAGAMGGAVLVDGAMFGPEGPSDAAVADCWSYVDQLRHDLAATYSRARRIRAALSVSTLAPRRRGRS